MVERILITGGAGYIGSELVGTLLRHDRHITVLDNLMYEKTSLLQYIRYQNFEFVKGDVRDHTLLNNLLKKSDTVISLAALVGAGLCEKNPQAALDINQKANEFLAIAKSKDQRLIYPNTNSGYGTTDGKSVITEKDPLNPISIYGKTKCAAETVIQASENYVTMRLATVFGASLRPRSDLLVNNLVLRAMRDKVLIVYEGHFMRNYIHINDICWAFKHVIENWDVCKNQTYNVGNDAINMSKLDMCKIVAKYIPTEIIEAQITQDPDKRNYVVSSQKFYDTGFKCQFTLDDGIKHLITQYKMLDEPWRANY